MNRGTSRFVLSRTFSETMRTKHFLALLFPVVPGFFLSGDLLANGGGYLTGGVSSSGSLTGFRPAETEKIRILEESLTAKLGPNSAKVEVRYRMKNETEGKTTVRFGFPVEETGRGESFDEDGDGIDDLPSLEGLDPEYLPKPHRELGYCRNYQVTAGGRPLKASWEGEQRGKEDPLFRHLAGWLVSELPFGAGEEKEVVIRFDSVYPKDVRWVSDDSHTGASVFKYRLSTAACWAGTIGKGRIVLEPDGIAPEELRVIKPVNRFRKEGRNWVWEFTGLEPTLADDFEVETQPVVRTYTRYDGDVPTTYAKRGERWTLAHTNYGIRASSTLPPQGDHNYEAENLKQWEAWAEGAKGPGIGEWLELTPVSPKPLVAISFDPGLDGGDDDRYANNGRPKKTRLELNGEHTVTMNVPDSPEEFRQVIEGYEKPVEKLRLTFEEVWPGKKYEDLCLRNLRLHVALDKKPEVQPAR